MSVIWLAWAENFMKCTSEIFVGVEKTSCFIVLQSQRKRSVKVIKLYQLKQLTSYQTQRYKRCKQGQQHIFTKCTSEIILGVKKPSCFTSVFIVLQSQRKRSLKVIKLYQLKQLTSYQIPEPGVQKVAGSTAQQYFYSSLYLY